MGQCSCGHTRDAEKNCDGTHKVVKAVREQIAKEIEATNSFEIAKAVTELGVWDNGAQWAAMARANAADIARGQK